MNSEHMKTLVEYGKELGIRCRKVYASMDVDLVNTILVSDDRPLTATKANILLVHSLVKM